MSGAQFQVPNLFFHVTPGSAQATYTAPNDVASSAIGNPTLITQAGDATGGTNKIAVPVTCRVLIALSVSAATTFLIRINGVDTVAIAATGVNTRHLFEDIWSPSMFVPAAGISFRFGASVTINYLQAVYLLA